MLKLGGKQLGGKAARAVGISSMGPTAHKVAGLASDTKASAADQTVLGITSATKPTVTATISKMGDGESGHKPRWWRPDPVTGVWIPEDSVGQIDTVELREQSRVRTEPTGSFDERAWWTSLEEVPERLK
eukprot:Gb_13949 [translate_table: standard]